MYFIQFYCNTNPLYIKESLIFEYIMDCNKIVLKLLTLLAYELEKCYNIS